MVESVTMNWQDILRIVAEVLAFIAAAFGGIKIGEKRANGKK